MAGNKDYREEEEIHEEIEDEIVPRGWRPSQVTDIEDEHPYRVDADGMVHVSDDRELKFNELRPNTLYEKSGFVYETDERGRTINAYGQIDLEKTSSRTIQISEIGHMGNETDEGGHIFGARFNGPSDAMNIVPQNMHLNRGEYKAMESEWAEAIKNRSTVNVQASLEYQDEKSIRPTAFYVLYWIDGVPHERYFPNGN